MSGWRRYIRLDNSNGDLTIQTSPTSGVAEFLNITSNISLACLTQLVRADRDFGELDGCIGFTYDLLVLRGAEVTFWPPKLTFPWEEGALAPVDTPATATAAALGNLTLGAAVAFTDPHHEEADAVIYPLDVLWFVFVFSFFFLLLSTICASAYYPYDAPPPPPQRVILVTQKSDDDDDDGDEGAVGTAAMLLR